MDRKKIIRGGIGGVVGMLVLCCGIGGVVGTVQEESTEGEVKIVAEEPQQAKPNEAEERYIRQTLVEVETLGNALRQLSALVQDAHIDDATWLNSVKAEADAINNVHFALAEAQVPNSATEMHAALLSATSECSNGATSFALAVELRDEELLKSGVVSMQECPKLLAEAQALVPAFVETMD